MSQYLYYYVRHEDERDLCQLEMRAFFNTDSATPILLSDRSIDPSRSPFIKGKIEILLTAPSEDELIQEIAHMSFPEEYTYKVISLNEVDFDDEKKWSHTNRRALEKKVGLALPAPIDLHEPDIMIGILYFDGIYYLGKVTFGQGIWFKHQQKPKMYSTALSSKLARTLVNIAVPYPNNQSLIDPCCGVGNVVVEAVSMGIPIVASDINPLVVAGTRENVAHFGYTGATIRIQSIHEITSHYDVAIIDLPYNLFTHITAEETLHILKSARRIATQVIFVAIDAIEDDLLQVGFSIQDRAIIKKGTFQREILICH
ncbi:MAG TPA: RsmD family RNA methyltransferase [Savagea sp.]